MDRQRIEDLTHKMGRYAPQGWMDCPFCGKSPYFIMKSEKVGLFGQRYDLILTHDGTDCPVRDSVVGEDVSISKLKEIWNTRTRSNSPSPVGLREYP